MCTTCGCSSGAHVRFTHLGSDEKQDIPQLSQARLRPMADDGGAPMLALHPHPHPHPHGHHPAHGHPHGNGAAASGSRAPAATAQPAAPPPPDEAAVTHARAHGRAQGRTHGHVVTLEAEVLEHNNRLAEANRRWLRERHILALNLVSSPGAGKTTLLERTLRELAAEIPISVVEGDQETLFDAERIRATGCPSVQVNTGTGCHLEAEMLARALRQLSPPAHSLLMIENVGNLVCPALFDLGEAAKVAILSVTEGADKPLKYPHMFRAASLMILNKIDLLPHVRFDVADCIAHARRVNPEIELLQLSATTGEGMAAWYGWLRARLAAASEPARPLRHTPAPPTGGGDAPSRAEAVAP